MTFASFYSNMLSGRCCPMDVAVAAYAALPIVCRMVLRTGRRKRAASCCHRSMVDQDLYRHIDEPMLSDTGAAAGRSPIVLLLVTRGSRTNRNPDSRHAYYLMMTGVLSGLLVAIVAVRADIIHFMYLMPLYGVVLAWILDGPHSGARFREPFIRS